MIQGVRGLGLLLGIGLNPEMVDAPGRQDGCRRGGGGSAAGGPAFRSRRPETVRLLPPLNVSEEEVQQALAIIRRVLKTYVK